jgi:cobalamin synthase
MKSALAAFKFLAVGGRFDEAESRYEASAVAALFFPLVGLVVGLSLAIVNRAFESHLESELLAVVLTATMLLITRAVHLDGTLQTFETLTYGPAFGESPRPTHVQGCLVVLLVVLFKIRAIEVIGDTRTLSLLLTPVLARWSLVIFLYGAAKRRRVRAAVGKTGVHLLVTTTQLWRLPYIWWDGALGRFVCFAFCPEPRSRRPRRYLRQPRALIELSETLSLVLFASL